MKILDRYIVKTMAFYTLAVLFIWLSVYGFLNFINEVDKIGKVGYTTYSAIIYVLMDLPAVAYSHSSVIILLGSLLALSHLAATSQLIVIRACGLSIMQIAKIVVKSALMFVVIIIFIGEWVAPISAQTAQNFRAKALGQNSEADNQQGFWLKDGNTIIHVKKNFSGHLFEDVVLINISQLKQLDSISQADYAFFDGQNLKLQNIETQQLDHAKKFVDIQSEHRSKDDIKVTFDQTSINSLGKTPEELSTWHLYKQINFLKNNSLNSGEFEVEFYKRLVRPMTLIAMILFSMLFIFGSLRNTSLGKNIFFGLMLSLCFELLSRISGVVSLKFDYYYFLSASMPTLVALAAVFILLRRKSAA